MSDIHLNRGPERFFVRRLLECILIILLAAFFFFEIKPYFFWSTGPIFFKFLSFSFLITSVIFLSKYKQISRNNLIVLSFYLFVMVILGFYSEGVNVGSIFAIIVISTLILLSDEIKYKAYKVIVNMFIVLSIPGIFTFFLLLSGYKLNYELIEPLLALKGELYRNYIFLVVPDPSVLPSPFGVAFRFSGVFDEPGVIGTFCVIFLSTRYVYDNLAKRIFFIVIGICSMSLVFYILCVFILLLYNPKRNFFIFGLIFLLCSSLFPLLKQISVVDRFVFSRLEMILEFDSKVNNREVDGFQSKFDELFKTTDFILGKGIASASSEFPGGASYKYFIYDHGILAFFAINIFFLYIVFITKIKLNDQIVFSIILLLCLMQRPYYDSIFVIIIIYGAIYRPVNTLNVSLNEKKERCNA